MSPRIDIFTNRTAGQLLEHVTAASRAVKDSPLPAVTRELVALRASPINGCGFCTDMHTKPAGGYEPGQFE